MYSVVLMAALGTGLELPACGRHGGCHRSCYSYSGCYYSSPCYYLPCDGAGDTGTGTETGTGMATGGGEPGDAPLTAAEQKEWTDFLESLKDVPDKQKKFKDDWDKKSNKEKRAFLKALKEAGKLPGPARILVSLPADATLKIDGQATSATSESRTFQSPVLKGGRVYYYELSAEVVRNGRRVVMTKKVEVRPGQDTRVTLDETAPDVVVAK